MRGSRAFENEALPGKNMKEDYYVTIGMLRIPIVTGGLQRVKGQVCLELHVV